MASLAMPMASAEQTPAPGNGVTPLPPRKFKASDLPLSSATRSAIEGLAHSFKKKGGYDAIRKQVWEKFEESVSFSGRYAQAILERISLSWVACLGRISHTTQRDMYLIIMKWGRITKHKSQSRFSK
jgi:hypothetical protein